MATKRQVEKLAEKCGVEVSIYEASSTAGSIYIDAPDGYCFEPGQHSYCFPYDWCTKGEAWGIAAEYLRAGMTECDCPDCRIHNMTPEEVG